MRSDRQQKQSGFTLIELVIVIVIIGILAAVAIPKFTSLTADAQQAATDGVAGSLGSASSTNAALREGLGTTKGTSVTSCAMVAGALDTGLPSGYTITGAIGQSAGATASCNLAGAGTSTATFTGHYAL